MWLLLGHRHQMSTTFGTVMYHKDRQQYQKDLIIVLHRRLGSLDSIQDVHIVEVYIPLLGQQHVLVLDRPKELSYRWYMVQSRRYLPTRLVVPKSPTSPMVEYQGSQCQRNIYRFLSKRPPATVFHLEY